MKIIGKWKWMLDIGIVWIFTDLSQTGKTNDENLSKTLNQIQYIDKNTNKKRIAKLANQTFKEKRLKEHCMTIFIKPNFEKDV